MMRKPTCVRMVKCIVGAFVACSLVWAGGARADGPPRPLKMDPAQVARGGFVVITGENLPQEATIAIDDVPLDPKAVVLTSDRKALTFQVPAARPDDDVLIRLGKHAVHLYAGSPLSEANRLPVDNAYLTIVPDVTEPLALRDVSPRTAYPTDDGFGLVLIGDGFSYLGEDQDLLMDGQFVPVCWRRCKGGVSGKVNPGRHQIEVQGIKIAPGTHSIRLRRVNAVTDEFSITFAAMTAERLRLYAASVACGLFAILGGLVWLASRRYRHWVDGRSYGFWSRILLDPETDTFSLSKLQFCLWTAAVTFAYVYFFLAETWVKGHFSLPNVPNEIIWLVLGSAATTVASQTIALARGPKGAGAVLPSAADFITSGGIVAPDRVQFFVWTLLSVGGFLAVTLAIDPAKMDSLPPIPSGLLTLMGASALGFLGGKVSRKPGPIVDSVIAKPGSLILEIRGRFLSKDASFAIEGVDLTPLVAPGREQLAERVIADPENADFATFVQVRVVARDDAWSEKKPQMLLAITNRDGQRAEWPFDVSPEVAEAIEKLPAPAAVSQSQLPTPSVIVSVP